MRNDGDDDDTIARYNTRCGTLDTRFDGTALVSLQLYKLITDGVLAPRALFINGE